MSITIVTTFIIFLLYIVGYVTYLSIITEEYDFDYGGFKTREPTRAERWKGLIWPILLSIGLLETVYKLLLMFLVGIKKLFV